MCCGFCGKRRPMCKIRRPGRDIIPTAMSLLVRGNGMMTLNPTQGVLCALAVAFSAISRG